MAESKSSTEERDIARRDHLGGLNRFREDLLVNRVSQSSDAKGIKGIEEDVKPGFPSSSSTFTPNNIPDTSMVQEIPVKLGNKIPKGY
jgi:hypothetical protein